MHGHLIPMTGVQRIVRRTSLPVETERAQRADLRVGRRIKAQCDEVRVSLTQLLRRQQNRRVRTCSGKRNRPTRLCAELLDERNLGSSDDRFVGWREGVPELSLASE